MSKLKTVASAKDHAHSAGESDRGSGKEGRPPKGQAVRETVESIAVAVILAFLFRAFVAEAFVIPTGSMAPTLMGQHKDVACIECGYRYSAGASIEIDDEETNQARFIAQGSESKHVVVATTCPLCRYRMVLDLFGDANQKTFSGDRILVSKFTYEFAEPGQWDVVVFKFPKNAKQNFIKRLIAKPNQTVLVKGGDVFLRQPNEERFQISRKPDRKLEAMLQMVDDTKHQSKSLRAVDWPSRWQPWFSREGLASASDGSSAWTADDEATWVCRTDGSKTQDTWLRYHHIVPSPDDWESIKAGNRPADLNDRKGQLITDFYGYNAFTSIEQADLDRRTYNPGVDLESYANPVFGSRSLHPYGTYGLHWVGDLALDCNVTVRSEEGQLLLLLVKGGINFWCGIDVATGIASLSVSGGLDGFTSDDGKTSAANPQGQTRVRGGGVYHVRFANADSEVRLWVNGTQVKFEGPTTYAAADRLRPVTTEADPGDLAPLGIGSRAASLEVHRLRVYRDIYYVATDGSKANEYRAPYSDAMILKILQTPEQWSETPLFDQRGEFIQTMGPDQFFPMGDNSPQSSDARMWTGHNYFERELLIGRAVLIYWPHPWYRPIPYFPNFERMRLIH